MWNTTFSGNEYSLFFISPVRWTAALPAPPQPGLYSWLRTKCALPEVYLCDTWIDISLSVSFQGSSSRPKARDELNMSLSSQAMECNGSRLFVPRSFKVYSSQ